MTINFFKKRFMLQPSLTRGFTLVEVIVALAILLVAVAGPISLIGDSLHKMYYARDEAIAVNLAQEGIEMIRQVRDTNMLAGRSWLTNLGGGAPSAYTIDVYSFTQANLAAVNTYVTYCGAACAPQPVKFDAVAGMYRQALGGTATPFSRIVAVSSAGLPGNEAKVTSTVNWTTGGTQGSVTVSEYIFSWAL